MMMLMRVIMRYGDKKVSSKKSSLPSQKSCFPINFGMNEVVHKYKDCFCLSFLFSFTHLFISACQPLTSISIPVSGEMCSSLILSSSLVIKLDKLPRQTVKAHSKTFACPAHGLSIQWELLHWMAPHKWLFSNTLHPKAIHNTQQSFVGQNILHSHEDLILNADRLSGY